MSLEKSLQDAGRSCCFPQNSMDINISVLDNDPSLDITISKLTNIFSPNNLKPDITPEEYVDIIIIILDRLDGSWVEHCCSATSSSAEVRNECSKRLTLLSSLITVLNQSSQSHDDLIQCVLQGKKKAPSNSDCGKAIDGIVTHSNEDAIFKVDAVETLQIFKNDTKKNEDENTLKWFEQASSLLLSTNKVINAMLWLFQSNCALVSYLAKKSVISCVACNPSQISIILPFVEASIIQDFKKNIGVFDLLHKLMSHKIFTDQSPVTSNIYDWFVENFEDKIMTSLSKLLKDNLFVRNEWAKLISVLSFIKKATKYGNNMNKEVQSGLLSLLMDILISHTHETSHHKEFFHQPVLLIIIKIFNFILDMNIILKKGLVRKQISEVAVQMIKLFPSLFINLRKNYFSRNNLFWGNQVSNKSNAKKEQDSSLFNYSLSKQCFILNLKSCLFSSYSGYIDGTEIECFTYQTYDMFKTWFVEERCNVRLKSEWLPAFLGEDDDQWIIVLLCLLLIKTPSKERQRKQVSTSQALYQSPCYPASQSHDLNQGKDQGIDNNEEIIHTVNASSPPSNYDKISTSIFLDSLCPHRLFIQFVKCIAFDHLVIADFLVSPETQFLAYFAKYLSLLNNEWECFSTYYDARQMVSIKEDYSISVQDSKAGVIETQSDEIEIEPIIKKIKLKRTSSKELNTSYKNTDVNINLSKKNMRNIPSLVSYSDSEESTNDEISDVDEDHSGIATSYHLSLGHQNIPNRLVSQKGKSINEECYDQPKESTIHPCLCDNATFHVCSKLTCRKNLNSEIKSVNSDDNLDLNKDAVEYRFNKENTLERFMTMLIRLQLHLERLNDNNLMPYNASFLLKLLNDCIDKYESV